MNLRLLFLKELRLVEFQIAVSSLFHSIMVDGKKIFLKLCLIFIHSFIHSFISISNVLSSITSGNNFE